MHIFFLFLSKAYCCSWQLVGFQNLKLSNSKISQDTIALEIFFQITHFESRNFSFF